MSPVSLCIPLAWHTSSVPLKQASSPTPKKDTPENQAPSYLCWGHPSLPQLFMWRLYILNKRIVQAANATTPSVIFPAPLPLGQAYSLAQCILQTPVPGWGCSNWQELLRSSGEGCWGPPRGKLGEGPEERKDKRQSQPHRNICAARNLHQSGHKMS